MKDIDRYQADYQSASGFERHMVRYRRRAVLESLARYPHANMLEIGCGMEPLFEHVTDWQEYTVVEPGSAFVAHAHTRIPAGRHIAIRHGFLEELVDDLQGTRFDFIVASSLLHEVSDSARFLTSVRSLCASETVVHINVPNAQSLHNRLAVKMGLIPDVFARSALAERMQRTGTFDLEMVTALVTGQGFRVDSSGTYFMKPFTHGQLQHALDARIIDERVLDALFEVSTEFPGTGAELFVNVRPV